MSPGAAITTDAWSMAEPVLLAGDEGQSPISLELEHLETTRSIDCFVRYPRVAFDAQHIADLARSYSRILERLGDGVDTPLTDLR